ncbi:heme oxygenase-domain-containing protein [Mycotypha africana]|uniref:heme oxygenase-domain-containing protein n=1 Tax=Mycotypha africana TaxID=64632 RepID=UPI002301A471|nr:heme oxygenase-domain-containing protein [Mycotypha africana]KAI8991242.1 heme oxygenase-domain-containing protein [Mycotypha africana]
MDESPGRHPMNENNEVKFTSNMNRIIPETQVTSTNKLSQDYLETPELASAMREGTKIVHSAAENSVFTKRFLNGEINVDEYGRYVTSLYFVYRTLENLLAQHKHNPVVQKVHFPYELNRENALLKDIEYYYGKNRVAEMTDFKNITPAVQNYITSLQDAAAKDPSLLIAHSYARYLGDLSGGQILAKRLKKHVLKISASDPAWDSYEGLEFYNFDHIGNHTEFKTLYRQCLNEARVTQEMKDTIVDEAIRAFKLNIALFDEIQYLSENNKLHTTAKDRGKKSSVSSTVTESSTLEGSTKRRAFNADWLVGFATGGITVALCISIYNRIYNSQ